MVGGTQDDGLTVTVVAPALVPPPTLPVSPHAVVLVVAPPLAGMMTTVAIASAVVSGLDIDEDEGPHTAPRNRSSNWLNGESIRGTPRGVRERTDALRFTVGCREGMKTQVLDRLGKWVE